MSEYTKTPWAYCDHGVGELVVYCPQTEDAICTFDDNDDFWAWKENYFVSGEAEANARHIVHCVNNHERLVEMVGALLANPGDSFTAHMAEELLAQLQADKGGE